MRDIKKIIFHCSDSDIPGHDNVKTLRQWHVMERGWSDIGYHYLITKNGSVYKCRPIERAGAHCHGENFDSIGICLSGKVNFTPMQIESATKLNKELCNKFHLMNDQIFGHNNFNSMKTCPNFDIKKVLPF